MKVCSNGMCLKYPELISSCVFHFCKGLGEIWVIFSSLLTPLTVFWPIWPHLGHIGPFLDHVGTKIGWWCHNRVILGWFWTIFGSMRGHFGVTEGSFLHRFGIILGRFGVVLTPFWGLFWARFLGHFFGHAYLVFRPFWSVSASFRAISQVLSVHFGVFSTVFWWGFWAFFGQKRAIWADLCHKKGI